MAIFPAIEPFDRAFDFGDFPMEEVSGWASGRVRFRTGNTSLTVAGLTLVLQYVDILQTEAQEILDHYAFQRAGSTTFTLPAIIWQGHDFPVAPGARYRYVERPAEDSRHGGWCNLTVTLEATAFTTDLGGVTVESPAVITVAAHVPEFVEVVPPIAATYSQSSVYSGNDAATAAVMKNGVFAEATQTGTDASALEWVRMDFGSVVSFSSVVVGCDFGDTLAGGWGQFYTENRDVETSSDGTTWTLLFNTGTFTQGIQTFAYSGSARYIRITAVDDYLAVTEFYATA
jgi:hypothetical protein